MLIALIVMIIRNHLIRLTLKTHTLPTPGASHPIAAISPLNRELTFFIRTATYVIFFHIFLESCIATLFGLLAGHSWVVVHLALQAV